MPDKPLRADARRNRDRVLAAAQQAFAAEGLAVPLDEIARRAGVGAGTVYRHFPTKEALFEAAIIDRIERMIAEARRLSTATDPGQAFFEFLNQMIADGGVKRDLADAVGARDAAPYAGLTRELNASTATLLHRAQKHGSVRADIGITDLMTMIKGLFLAIHTAVAADAGLSSRAFAVLCDGLRANT